MKKITHTLLVFLGISILIPALAFAQTGASSSTPGIRANVKTNLQASTTPRNTSGVKLEARLERAKEKAAQEIERRTEALTKLKERIAAMKRVSTNFKTDLDSTVAAEVAKLEALAAKIAASTNGEEIKTDVQSITRSYRTFILVMPKASIAAAADRLVTMSATLSEVGGKLKTRIDEAASQGKDVTTLNTQLNELAAKITSANTHARAAVEGTAELTPDEGDKTKQEANRAALQKARDELKAGHEDIKAGREIIRKIVSELKPAAGTTTSAAGV